MKNIILSLAGGVLLGASALAATVSDRAGLTLEWGDNGNISGIAMNGAKLSPGTAGGFYLREPNTHLPHIKTRRNNPRGNQETGQENEGGIAF
jgi:hypothetical protein